MINISEQAVNKISDIVWAYGILIAFGAVGFMAGRLSGYNETDLEIAKIEGKLEQLYADTERLREAHCNDAEDEE